jgi:hypothetical protein
MSNTIIGLKDLTTNLQRWSYTDLISNNKYINQNMPLLLTK